MRTLAFHQCVQDFVPGLGVICEWSLLLLVFPPTCERFSSGAPVFAFHLKKIFSLISFTFSSAREYDVRANLSAPW